MVSSSLQGPIVSASIERFSVFICSLPLLSFASCVLIAVLWHFDETTRTHCKVREFLNYLYRLFLCPALLSYVLKRFVFWFSVVTRRSSIGCQPRGIIC